MGISGNNGDTYISSGTVITGDITSQGDLTVKGKVIGNITSEGDVTMAGRTEGNINANNLVIQSGCVKGNMTVANKLNIENAEQVEGEIVTKTITIKECQNFNANIKTIS